MRPAAAPSAAPWAARARRGWGAKLTAAKYKGTLYAHGDARARAFPSLQHLPQGHRLRGALLRVQRLDLQPPAHRPVLLLGRLLGRAPPRGAPPRSLGRGAPRPDARRVAGERRRRGAAGGAGAGAAPGGRGPAGTRS